MKILVLAHSIAWPIHDGYVLHLFHLARSLAPRHELHLLCLGNREPGETMRSLFRSITMVPRRPQPHPGPAWKRLRHALDGDQLHDLDPHVLATLRGMVEPAAGFDALWVCGTRMLAYSQRLRGPVPVLADLADDEVLACRNEFFSAPLARRPRALLQWIRTRRYLAANLPHATLATVVAEPDRASLLRRHPDCDVRVVVNGVNSDFFHPEPLPPRVAPGAAPPDAPSASPLDAAPAPPEPGPLLVFEGNMGFLPNAEGAVHFCRRILPLIRRELPDVRVALVGRDPTPQVAALAGPGIEVTGRIEDVRPHLRRATVFVCPLLSGTGIKNKILQAWSLGLPVVATSISCGGLDVRPGRNIELADGPRAFADAVVRLVRDPGQRARLGAAGRAQVIAQHRWEASAQQLEELLLHVALGGRADVTPAAAPAVRPAATSVATPVAAPAATPVAGAGYRGAHASASLTSHHS